MLGPDPEQQREAFAQVEQSLDRFERDFGAFFKQLAIRWAARWAVVFAVIFVLTQLVEWLDWLWWIAVPIAVVSLAAPLLFRRFLMKRLAKARGQMGMSGRGEGGQTIDGSWQETTGNARHDAPPAEPGTIIIDQRDPDENGSGGGRL